MTNRKCDEPGCERAAAWISTSAERTDRRECLCSEHWREQQARQSAAIADYSPIRNDEREVAARKDLPAGDDATMDVAFEVCVSYLHVRLEGHWNPRTMQETILKVRDESARHSMRRLLVDGRKIASPASDFYRYLAGQDAARFLPPPYRTAVIGLPEVVTGFGETVANIGGADLKVFVADAPAMEWLMRGVSATGG